MAKNVRFTRSTKGYNAEVYVLPKDAETPSGADYEAFQSGSAVNGTVGVFLVEDNSLVTGALSNGDKFYVAQKRDSGIKRSVDYVFNDTGGTRKVEYTAPVKEAYTISFTGYTPEAGDILAVKVIDFDSESQFNPTFTYEHFVKASDTLATIYSSLADAINGQPTTYGTGDDHFVKATASATELVIEHLFEGAPLRIALPGKSFEVGTATKTTPLVVGSGFPAEVFQLELEGTIFEGVTTQYPGGVFSPLDFGTPGTFTEEDGKYDVYNVSYFDEEYSPTPINKHHHKKYLVLCAEISGDGKTYLDTVFGF